MKKLMIFAVAALLTALSVQAQDIENIAAGWQRKTITNVPSGSLDVMLQRFYQTWPSSSVGEVLSVIKTGAAKQVIDAETERTVINDAKNGYVEVSDAGTDDEFMSACVWRRSNGHRLFAVNIGKPTDPDIEFLCLYDYDPQRKTLTPEPDILADFLYEHNDSRLRYTLPRVGKELKIVEWKEGDSDFRREHIFSWNGMKPVLNTASKPVQNTESKTEDLPFYRFDAKLDGRILVNIAFQQTDNDIIAGYIYYPQTKTPAPIMIAGTVVKYGQQEFYMLEEYQADGTITGSITLLRPKNDSWNNLSGDWTNPKTQKQMKLTDISSSREKPEWFDGTLLKPEDPGNIGREYGFKVWDWRADCWMGGNITFRAAGKNRVHFDCSNVRHNIAEGRSAADRPAVLRGNTFEYRHVNECGYAFRATFFPKFVVLQTTTETAEALDCFGAGASFNGVYIKVKQ